MTDVPDGYAEQIRDHRAEKDQFFDEHRQSPIPPEERDEFDGLNYYDPDPDYRVEATVEVHDDPETVELDTSDGRTMEYRRVATFSFEVHGESCELHGYMREDSESIFVPFRDKTTGQQTYKDGRYMELEVDGELESGDEITIDFNLAYAPFCAYSDTFSCPLPPEENWLDVLIEAGEKEY